LVALNEQPLNFKKANTTKLKKNQSIITTHKIFSLLTFCIDKELKSSLGTRDVCIFPSHETKVVLEDTSNVFQEALGEIEDGKIRENTRER
jgi:predicted component of viral defense system (DUF524 family)